MLANIENNTNVLYTSTRRFQTWSRENRPLQLAKPRILSIKIFAFWVWECFFFILSTKNIFSLSVFSSKIVSWGTKSSNDVEICTEWRFREVKDKCKLYAYLQIWSFFQFKLKKMRGQTWYNFSFRPNLESSHQKNVTVLLFHVCKQIKVLNLQWWPRCRER